MFETILVHQEGAVATVTINRPEANNTFSLSTYGEIKEAMELCGNDENIRVIVLTGAGKHFCAGGDIKRFKNYIESGQPPKRETILMTGAMQDSIRLCPKPVIAMINGFAMGAGCALTLSCDFRVMTPNSKLGMAFVNLGFSGDTGSIYFLSRIVGIAKTTEMMALGTLVGGEEALRLGLVTRLAENDNKLKETTDELVQDLLKKPPLAIAWQKRLYYEFLYRDLAQFYQREADYMYDSFTTEDHKEAVYAYLEKRTPIFVGR